MLLLDASRAEVNRQLSAMRKQLLSEQRRIEMQIDNKHVSAHILVIIIFYNGLIYHFRRFCLQA